MEGQVNLLGTTIELASAAEAMQRTREFLDDVKNRHVIRFVDIKACTLASQDEVCASLISKSDYVLPADLATEKGIEELVKGHRDVFWHKDYFDALYELAVDDSREIFFVTETQSMYDDLEENIHATYPYLSVHGFSVEGLEVDKNYEMIANEINAVAPDILFIYVDIEKQNILLTACENLLNASLLICGKGMFENPAELIIDTPSEEDSKQQRFFRAVRKLGRHIKHIVTGTIFKLKIKSDQKEAEVDESVDIANHDSATFEYDNK